MAYQLDDTRQHANILRPGAFRDWNGYERCLLLNHTDGLTATNTWISQQSLATIRNPKPDGLWRRQWPYPRDLGVLIRLEVTGSGLLHLL